MSRLSPEMQEYLRNLRRLAGEVDVVSARMDLNGPNRLLPLSEVDQDDPVFLNTVETDFQFSDSGSKALEREPQPGSSLWPQPPRAIDFICWPDSGKFARPSK